VRALQLVEWHHEAELRDVAEPEPGPGELVVRIAGAGACHSDLHLMHDFVEGMLPFGPPFTLGHENSGWIDAIGAGVRGIELGQPVLVYGAWGCGRCRRCREGAENYCERQQELGVFGGGLGLDGGMATKMLVPSARHVVPLGDAIDPVDAAPLADAALTPYHAIRRSSSLLGPGSVAVVIGVGGLGLMAVELLEALTPARIVAVDSRESALQAALAAGASDVFGTSGSADDTVAEVARVTNGQLADVVLDFVGVDATLALASRVVRTLGHLTLVGIGGGTWPFSFFSTPYEVSIATTYWGTLPELMDVVALAEAGTIRTTVTRFALEDAPQAYTAMQSGELRGRAVVVPDGG
jgi:propanol-preferring alcohol dehydrogenase